MKGTLPLRPAATKYQAAGAQFVLAVDGAGGNDGTVFQSARADQPTLAAEKNRRLLQHHPPGNIPDERSGRLVLVGGEVKVNIRAADLAVVLAVGAAGHETITEIDQATQGYERKQDRLFQPNGVGDARLLFEDCASSDMRTGTGRHTVQHDRILKKTSVQVDIGSDLAVDDGHWRFST